MANGGGKWVGITEAVRLLGATRDDLERLARIGKIQTTRVKRGDRTTRYSVVDLERLKEDDNPEPLLNELGSLNLNGRVADWVKESFVSRVDSCWMFLHSHGYIDKDVSQAIRDRIVADVDRSGASRNRFASTATSSEERSGG